jgi:hypothetical protein
LSFVDLRRRYVDRPSSPHLCARADCVFFWTAGKKQMRWKMTIHRRYRWACAETRWGEPGRLDTCYNASNICLERAFDDGSDEDADTPTRIFTTGLRLDATVNNFPPGQMNTGRSTSRDSYISMFFVTQLIEQSTFISFFSLAASKCCRGHAKYDRTESAR